VTRLLVSLTLTLAGTLGCRPRADGPAARAPGDADRLEPSAACAEPARLVDPARASAMWVIQAPSAAPGGASSRLAGQYYSSGRFHIVILDTLGGDACWRTADSIATPVASPTEFLTNACGPTPDDADRRWVAVIPDTTAQVPRVAWRLRRNPPRIAPAAVDSVRCWRTFTG
jgi:hypothetical protein